MVSFILPISHLDIDNRCVFFDEDVYYRNVLFQLEDDACLLFYDKEQHGICGHAYTTGDYSYIYNIHSSGYVYMGYDVTYYPYNQPVDIGGLFKSGAMYKTGYQPRTNWYLSIHQRYINDIDAELIRMIGTQSYPYSFSRHGLTVRFTRIDND